MTTKHSVTHLGCHVTSWITQEATNFREHVVLSGPLAVNQPQKRPDRQRNWPSNQGDSK